MLFLYINVIYVILQYTCYYMIDIIYVYVYIYIYKEKVRTAHPDKGGDPQAFCRIRQDAISITITIVMCMFYYY